jgi:hypothetical protein
MGTVSPLIEDPALEYGDPEVAARGEILRTVVGSGVHGIAIPGTDDHDEMGVYIPPPEYVLGVRNYRDSYIARTQPEGERSGPEDTDLVMYSLRKYLSLAMKGNPTALLPLYAPDKDLITCTRLGKELREMREYFLSAQAVERFLGYMEAQHERMMGQGKRNRVPNRPELVEAHGWDTKYGSHALRLAYQGHEIAYNGTLTLPLAPGARHRVLDVKQGRVSREDVSAEITRLAKEVRLALRIGHPALAVPRSPHIALIEEFSVYAHREFWGWM